MEGDRINTSDVFEATINRTAVYKRVTLKTKELVNTIRDKL